MDKNQKFDSFTMALLEYNDIRDKWFYYYITTARLCSLNSSLAPRLNLLEEGDFKALFFIWVFILQHYEDLSRLSRDKKKWETAREYLPGR